MSTTTRPEKTYFETQREALIEEICKSFDQVLLNLNHLNRSLEGLAGVGQEFTEIEALWSKFDTVMSQPINPNDPASGSGGEDAQ
ncbi:hypothetical protein TWF225_009184 [Orbilia oligospora]|uniref:DASH complex subunit DAD1 n=1 Tax=Orbilia oligospora TaxID=2813651 RepID=A0A7C8PR01_ORBOL|nr:hypothetical protein TWF751_003756 [Orbilia oligospora]KAF3193616.1 hypothetical protein TWF225_009184 [Orbilia oligospora]KAF3239962.1 hypothetical protein TWF128_011450 [Orbilia oligospora]KAF3265865.1 hypothetical protein TWF217_002390 [Orbilia oligospora]KAF3276750.1 hypothetical protein TWF132_001879 [Orbilia oligospora]